MHVGKLIYVDVYTYVCVYVNMCIYNITKQKAATETLLMKIIQMLSFEQERSVMDGDGKLLH